MEIVLLNIMDQTENYGNQKKDVLDTFRPNLGS